MTVPRPLPPLARLPNPLTLPPPVPAPDRTHPLRSSDGDAGRRRRRRWRRGRGGHTGPPPDPGRAQEARAGSALPRGACVPAILHSLSTASCFFNFTACLLFWSSAFEGKEQFFFFSILAKHMRKFLCVFTPFRLFLL